MNCISKPAINVVIALPAEATSLVQHWRLKKSNRPHPFQLFQCDDIRLVVTGIGKCNSAAATAWLAGINNDQRQRHSIWINIGIAGHGTQAIGTPVTASRVIDTATMQSWYPTLINNPMSKSVVKTVDRPTSQYDSNNTIDMEASGYYQTALRISTTELIQCYKVISDNSEHPLSTITPEHTKSLIGDNIPVIAAQLEILRSLANNSEVIDTSEFETLFHRQWQFSATQKNQLQRLLHRQLAIFGHCEHAQDVLQSTSGTNVNTAALLAKLCSVTDQSC